MKRPALQNGRVGVLQMAFRDQIFFRTFEKRAPGRERLEDVEKSENFPQNFQLKMAGLK